MVKAITWPQLGVTELIDITELVPMPGEAIIDVVLSVSNPGTERARYLGLPTATVGFPHVPGIGAVGHVRVAAPGIAMGDLVAIRSGLHQSAIQAPVERLRKIPPGADLFGAALWQVGLVAMHGLGLGQYSSGEPLTIVGAGLVGATTRRIAVTRGTTECRVIAASVAKIWTVQQEPGIEFLCVQQLSNLARRHALVMEATGTSRGLATAVMSVADGGRIVLLGSPRALTGLVGVRELHERGLRLVGAHIDTLPDASARGGVDLLASYTSEYFALLDAGSLAMADLVTVYTPSQAPVLYRQLVSDRTLVAPAVAWSAKLEQSAGSRIAHVKEPLRPLRFGVVGCGDIGFQDAEALQRSAEATLVACFDTDPTLSRAVANGMAVRATESLADLLRDPGIDAVLVATPHDTHEEIAQAVLDTGKHLLLEKPLSADLPSARRIAKAARHATGATSVLFPGRYTAGYRAARTAQDEGMIGPVVGMVATYLVNKPPSYYCGGYSGRSLSTWRLSKVRSGGGFLIMNLMHHMDIAQSLMRAEAEWVFAWTGPSRQSPEIEDFAAVMIGYGGTVATFVGAGTVPGAPGEHFRLWGTTGQCVVLPAWQFTSADPTASVRLKPEPDDPPCAAIDGFVAAIRSGRDPDVTVNDALSLQTAVAAAYESARLGRPIRLAEF